MIQVREEYRGIISKLKAMILSEEQTSEEDAILLKTTEEDLARMLQEVRSIRTKLIENMVTDRFKAGR